MAAAQDWRDTVAEGDRYFHAGDFADAAERFATAAERFPEEPIPRLARGHALFAMGDFPAASRSLQAGIHLLPSWHESGIDLRGFFTDPGVFGARLIALADRVQAAPGDQELLFLLAYCLHFAGQPDAARALFEDLLSRAPDHEAARTFVDDTDL